MVKSWACSCRKMDSELRQLGIETATDLRRQPKGELIHRFGERTGVFLYLAARGRVGMENLTICCWPRQYGRTLGSITLHAEVQRY